MTRPEPLQDLVDAPPTDRPRRVTRRIRKLMANILGIPREQPIAEDSPFNQLGVDSLLALRLRNAVQADYWVDIPVVRFVTDLSVATLAATILEQIDRAGLLQDGAVGLTPAPAGQPATASQIAQAEWVEGEL